MPTHILRPTSVVLAGSWVPGSGTDIGNISDANDGTSIYNTDGDDAFVVEYQDLVSPGSIISVTSKFRHSRSGGGGEITQYLLRSGSYSFGAWIAPSVGITQTNELLTRPGGGTWLRSEINTLQGGCESRTGDPGQEVYVYDIWLSVLTRGGGSAFADLLSLVFGGGVIPALAWQQFARVRRELYRLTGTRILDDEMRTAIDAMRCDPRRAYSF